MIARFVTVAGLAAVLTMPAAAQGGGAATPPAPLGPNVGETAPEFSAPGANKDGVLKNAIKLSDLKGKTVVLAFFPQARTRGCTIEMEHFRDEYTKIFNDGKGVVLLGISTDPADTLAAWAKDANFPFQFVSDKDRKIGLAYGTLIEGRQAENRYLYVIAPDGKIQYTKKPMSPASPAPYEELTAEIRKNVKAN